MKREFSGIVVGLCVCGMTAAWAAPAAAQMSEVKEKSPLYTYVAEWDFPRAQWADVMKANVLNQKIMDKGIAAGTIVGYGSDVNLIHQADGLTHDDWWSANSMAGVLNMLSELETAGDTTTSVLTSATDHSDNIYVSHFYNWHPGSVKDGYTYTAFYTLQPDAPDGAVDTLSKNLIVPLLEKMLADGTVREYEVDTQAVHTEAPGTFLIIYLVPTAEDLDKVNAALRDSMKASPLTGPAFTSMVIPAAHHDELVRTTATYK